MKTIEMLAEQIDLKYIEKKGKKGSYDAYLIPEGIEDYSYTKDGKEVKGSQYKFKMEFPKRNKK